MNVGNTEESLGRVLGRTACGNDGHQPTSVHCTCTDAILRTAIASISRRYHIRDGL